MWQWARDLDRQELLWFEFARPTEVEPGSPEDIAIQLTEGWILGSSPTVRRHFGFDAVSTWPRLSDRALPRRSLGLAIGNGSLARYMGHSAVSTPEKGEPIPDQRNRDGNIISEVNSWNGF